MTSIQILVTQIEEKLESAQEHAKYAILYKTEDRELAEMHNRISIVDTEQVDMMHNQIVRLIKLKKASGAQVPPQMQKLYDAEHAKLIDKTAKIRTLQSIYKGS